MTALDDTVVVRACKYDGREHRRWSAKLLRQEGSLVVLDAYFPEEVIHSQLGTIASGTHSLEYYWLDRWFNVFRFAQPDGQLRNYYCNVNLPPTLEKGVLSYIDLDLDILVEPDYSFQVLDAEDFESNARIYRYPDDLQSKAANTVDDLIGMIESREFPFNE